MVKITHPNYPGFFGIGWVDTVEDLEKYLLDNEGNICINVFGESFELPKSECSFECCEGDNLKSDYDGEF